MRLQILLLAVAVVLVLVGVARREMKRRLREPAAWYSRREAEMERLERLLEQLVLQLKAM